ncbi:hypothetical protein B0T14DRAFT_563830 [Immersiella caudata]|uniref:Uncharacterized protein n=1 Tax=Immersiella caudata TaxID=314043 RepID=A0AA40C2X4_9PEZI|nr:hypothetical protein B0T14DRAFT_563830 [Immersiella caudata]
MTLSTSFQPSNKISRLRVLIPCDTGNGKEEWIPGKEDFPPENLIEVVSALPPCYYAFLQTKKEKNKPFIVPESILRHFNIPELVATRTFAEINGGFGHRAVYRAAPSSVPDDERTRAVSSCSTWFRCLFKMMRKVETKTIRHEDGFEYTDSPPAPGYTWFEMTVLTYWNMDGSSKVLCIDAPTDLPDQLLSALTQRRTPLDFKDPFVMHADLWDRIIVLYDISVWRMRDPVRELEDSNMRSRDMFAPTHGFTRHAIHVSEVLESAILTAVEARRCMTETHKALSPGLDQTYCRQADDYASFQISMLRNLRLRSESNRARLADEIHSAFNDLTRRDSSLIKSITIVTLLCLPASLISSIFSTTFFSFGDDNTWQVSRKLWVYWVTAIPSTIVIVLAWGLWYTKGDMILRPSLKLAARWRKCRKSKDPEKEG